MTYSKHDLTNDHSEFTRYKQTPLVSDFDPSTHAGPKHAAHPSFNVSGFPPAPNHANPDLSCIEDPPLVDADDSLLTLKNLRVNKTEDAESLMQMDKGEIIVYYEQLLDKC